MNKLSLPLAILLAGCSPQAPGAAALQPTPAVKLSQFSQASTTDLAVGADGTIHVLFGERTESTGLWRVYYRASTDGGASWSTPLNLTEVDPQREAGYMRLAIDGQNHVYAFWKAFKNPETVAEPAAAPITGSLVYRVLAGGAWSNLQTLGTAEHVNAWFPAVAPDGRLSVVWDETRDLPGPLGFTPPTAKNADVYQAGVTAEAAGAPTRLVHPQPDGTSQFQVDSYDTLQGYVDAQGLAHFVAQKTPAGQDGHEQVVLWDGHQEHTLFPLAQVAKEDNPYVNSPARLVLDEHGAEHLIEMNQLASPPTVEDRSPATGAPATLFTAAAADSQLQGFTAIAGPGGQLAAAVATKDPAKSPELLLVTRTNGAWGQPGQLTSNGLAGAAGSAYGATTSQTVSFNPRAFALALDAQGHTNVALVDVGGTETNVGTFGYAAGAQSSGFTLESPDVYFLRI